MQQRVDLGSPGPWVRHARAGTQQREQREIGSSHVTQLRPKAPVHRNQLVEIRGARQQQKAQRHEKIALTFLTCPVGDELLEEQTCRAWKPKASAGQFELDPGGDQPKRTEHEQRELVVGKDIGFGRILCRVDADEVDFQQVSGSRYPHGRFVR